MEAIFRKYRDIKSDNVLLLIREITDKYIVFIDADRELDYEITDEYEKVLENKGWKEKVNAVYNRIAELEHDPAVQYFPANRQMVLLRLLGNGFTSALDGSEEEARKSLEKAESYLQSRSCEVSRCWVLLFSFAAALAGWGVWYLFSWGDFLLFGCLGALFSILCKAGKLEYDCQAGPFLNGLEIFSRFLAAVISAYLAEQLYLVDLLFSVLKNSDHSSAAVHIICFIAGFSERLLPSVVMNLGKREEEGGS